jgi:hypothetical protein
MEPLTIKTPADVLSFVGHTLGFWPHESLVCITLDANRVGATLRVDLPTPGGRLQYARTVADYLAHDASAASATDVLVAPFSGMTVGGRARTREAPQPVIFGKGLRGTPFRLGTALTPCIGAKRQARVHHGPARTDHEIRTAAQGESGSHTPSLCRRIVRRQQICHERCPMTGTSRKYL